MKPDYMMLAETALMKRLITQVYPSGIVSVVSDSFDLWKVLTETLPRLKNDVLARNGKLVVRPDTGDPADIVCGDPSAPAGSPERLGVVQLLWDCFGGTETSTGHRLLDEHVGVIYGDGISPQRQIDMLTRMAENGFASANIILGLGSFSYQYVTRDTDGWAMKATWGQTASRGGVDIFKDPVTGDGSKKSARGRLRVEQGPDGLVLIQECDELDEQGGLLETVFLDGAITRTQTLGEIRKLVADHG